MRERSLAPLMSMPEIAELAKVKRPVVTNWRRRHAGFPQPVSGDAAAPFFDPQEVADWLVDTGRLTVERAREDLSFYTLARLGHAELSPRELVFAVTSLICLRHLDDDEPLASDTGSPLGELENRAARLDAEDELLLSEIRALPHGCAWLCEAVDELVEAAWGTRRAFERVLEMRKRFSAADLCVSAVTPQLARLMASLCGIREQRGRAHELTVTDPAAGPGDLLMAVAAMLDEAQTPMFTGAETDPGLTRLARRRLIVHGARPADLDLRAGGWPDDDSDSAHPDAIVTQLPYESAESRSAADVLDRLDNIALALPAGSGAVVLGPADVLADGLAPYSANERLRARMLTEGMVEAVIRLPGGLVPFRPGYETALWVLTSDHSTRWRGRVLLADVSDRPLDDAVVDALVADVVTWRREGYEPRLHARRFAADTPVQALVDHPGPLIPPAAPLLAAPDATAAADVARVRELEGRLEVMRAAAVDKRQAVASPLAEGSSLRPPSLTVGKLVRDRRLFMRRGCRFAAADLSPDGNHPVIGVPEILGQRGRGSRRIDRSVLVNGYPRARLTEPGDVVVTAVPELGAVVDNEGFSAVEFPARVLRIPESEREEFAPQVLASLLAAAQGNSRTAGSVRPSKRLEEHRIPVFPPEAVAALDRFLAVVEERRRTARSELDLLRELEELAVHGLMNGRLTTD